MDPAKVQSCTVCHVVAMPYPGRGHINPMMNICKLLASKKHDILITFVVTEEWLGFIGSDAKPNNSRFASIPNVIPSELVRGAEYSRFFEAVMTKMEVPFEQLLNQLEPTVTNIIADAELLWPIRIGNCRNIPVASLFTTLATVFSMLHCFDHIQDLHFLVDSLEHGDELVDNISSKQVADLRTIFHGSGRRVTQLTLETLSWMPKTQYLLFNSVYELEAQVYESLKTKFPFHIYPIGPAIPHFEYDNSSITISPNDNYLEWLDLQPTCSVLYVSLGSFLSISTQQMDDIATGLQNSGVRFLWVARREISRYKKNCGEMGLVVPWCDQLKVLSHCSIGGFWTHCGWNSTLEALFAGIPMLTFPINYDQVPNSEKIVDDWKIGWKVRERVEDENFVNKEEIAELVHKFMDQNSIDVKNMRKKARELREICHRAVAKGGSSDTKLDAFINEITKSPPLK